MACTVYAFSNEMLTDAKSLTQLLLNTKLQKFRFGFTFHTYRKHSLMGSFILPVGNCWFLASVGALTFQKKLFPHIIPPGQSLRNNYAGIFHFRVKIFISYYK